MGEELGVSTRALTPAQKPFPRALKYATLLPRWFVASPIYIESFTTLFLLTYVDLSRGRHRPAGYKNMLIIEKPQPLVISYKVRWHY